MTAYRTPRSFTPPPNWQRGDRVTWEKLRTTSLSISELQRAIGGQQDDQPEGTTFGPAGDGVNIYLATITTETDDTLAVDADIGAGPEAFIAAKPFGLRGGTGERQEPTTGELQEIYPAYTAAAKVYVYAPVGGTDISVPPASDGNEYQVLGDGRVWRNKNRPSVTVLGVATAQGDDTLTVLADLGDAGGNESIVCAKPPSLRLGAGNTSTGPGAREVNGEAQEIIPPYVLGTSEVLIMSVASGVGPITGVAPASDGREYMVLADGRVWAEVP